MSKKSYDLFPKKIEWDKLATWTKFVPFLFVASLVYIYLYQLNSPYLIFWLMLPLYYIHQFEEHIYPGNFTKYFNRYMFDSDKLDHPMKRKGLAILLINVTFTFVLFPASLFLMNYLNEPFFGLWIIYMVIYNTVGGHIIPAIKLKSYTDGLIASIIQLPICVYAIYLFGALPLSYHIIGFLLGLLSHAYIGIPFQWVIGKFSLKKLMAVLTIVTLIFLILSYMAFTFTSDIFLRSLI